VGPFAYHGPAFSHTIPDVHGRHPGLCDDRRWISLLDQCAGYVGHPETFGLIDTTASLLEIVVIVGVVLLLVRMRRHSSAVHQDPQADLAGLPGDSLSP
jgi:hypothetical protein